MAGLAGFTLSFSHFSNIEKKPMNAFMINWLDHPHADFVLAAYGIAAVALIGLAVVSWRAYRCRAREWQKLSSGNADQ